MQPTDSARAAEKAGVCCVLCLSWRTSGDLCVCGCGHTLPDSTAQLVAELQAERAAAVATVERVKAVVPKIAHSAEASGGSWERAALRQHLADLRAALGEQP